MKNIKIITSLFFTVLIISGCFGDKKSAIGQSFEDTSFVNKNYTKNKVNYTKGMSACTKLSTNALAKLYDVTETNVVIEDPTKSDRYKKPISGCMLYIKTGNSDYEWLRGSIEIKREIKQGEQMYDIAKATGYTADWVEAWNLKKTISKSSEWVPNIGKAALWNSKKNMLEIKFIGYTLVVKPLKNILNKEEISKNRNYKKVAISIARDAGFIN